MNVQKRILQEKTSLLYNSQKEEMQRALGIHTWANESLREWAGSVETTRVGWPLLANLTARLAARLVLPTPPLPPNM
jgi:hypothetical protein